MPKEMQNLENYKQQVRRCLIQYNNCTGAQADEHMALYENDFQEFLNDDWGPEAVALGMVMHLI